ncbi:MAG: nucleotide sugar dehydrogenase [Dehalococcoidales bacterium]|jgi:nucleotide sugar dehydrogenase|nr:nucleotide sugar dehydrogenase [Dehalococcoidales bacterium]
MIYLYNEKEIKNLVKERNLNIAVVGLGRVGLPMAAILANAGFAVTGIDVSPEIVEAVNAARVPYPDEEQLAEMVCSCVGLGKLYATLDIRAIERADMIIVAVPTLIIDEEPDITAVHTVAKQLSTILKPGKLLVLQSTVPPGTTEGVLGKIITGHTNLKPGTDFGLAYSPERTQSPQVLRDLRTYPKIIGAIDEKSASILGQIYATFAPSIINMSSITAAELDKVAENTYRDVNIAFANELALLCQLYGVDVTELISTANSQPYSHVLQPGLVGGHCIPMDPYYILADARKRGFTPALISTARNLNEEMFNVIAGMVEPDARKVTVLGLSFKPDVCSFDTSHTPRLVKKLEEKGYSVTVHDPFLEGNYKGMKTEEDVYAAIEGADAIILSTAHSIYRNLDFNRIKELMQGNVVIDVRNFFNITHVKQAGLIYKGLGRIMND